MPSAEQDDTEVTCFLSLFNVNVQERFGSVIQLLQKILEANFYKVPTNESHGDCFCSSSLAHCYAVDTEIGEAIEKLTDPARKTASSLLAAGTQHLGYTKILR